MTRRQIRPPGHHIVTQGEDVPMIAWQYGFRDWSIVWDHPENRAVKDSHSSPKVLAPGTPLFIPENADTRFDLPVRQVHRVDLDPPKTRLEVQIRIADRPFANQEYILAYKHGATLKRFEDRCTDGEGYIREENIPMAVTHVGVVFKRTLRSYQFALRALDPVRVGTETRLHGVQARLNNLGFSCGRVDGQPTKKTLEAIKWFQCEVLQREEASGELDDETLDALVREHGA